MSLKKPFTSAVAETASTPCEVKMDKGYYVRGAYYRPSTPEYAEFAKGLTPQNSWLAGGNIYLPEEKLIREENLLYGRRANPKNKFGAKDRMESLNTPYDRETISSLLNAYKDAAKRHGITPLHPDDLTNMALVEGRSNFGYNEYNTNNKRALKIAKDLEAQGHDPYAAGFPAAIIDKQMTAQRLGVPFYQVWNGAGPAAKDYNKRIEQHKYAVQDPRNKELRDFISQSLGYMPTQKRAEAETEAEPQFKRGGSVKMPDNYSSGSWKLI